MSKNLLLLLFKNSHIRNVSHVATSVGKSESSIGTVLSKLMPWYVTGLVDGDGMFGCIMSKTNKTISLEFKITALSSTSLSLIEELKTFFNPCLNLTWGRAEVVVEFL